MVYTIDMLLEKYANYHDPYNKITRLCKQGKLFKLKRGLYEDNPTLSPYLISAILYGPSYISFEYALAYYDLIPERVYTITCATTIKGKKRNYHNYYGDFSYRDIPTEAFIEGLEYYVENNYAYLIACKEKAICDKLYELKPVSSIKELKYLLFDNLRIDENDFAKLDKEKFKKLCPLYKSTNLYMLERLISKNE